MRFERISLRVHFHQLGQSAQNPRAYQAPQVQKHLEKRRLPVRWLQNGQRCQAIQFLAPQATGSTEGRR